MSGDLPFFQHGMDSRGTILVADDNDALRSLLTSLLSREGYRILEADDGASAIRLLEEEEVDAAVIDVRLGTEDGVAVSRELRRIRPGLAIALMSGSVDANEAKERGADLTDLFLAKPFALKAVAAIVEQMLDRR
jgi:DNA-binding NtrC family response regulator